MKIKYAVSSGLIDKLNETGIQLHFDIIDEDYKVHKFVSTILPGGEEIRIIEEEYDGSQEEREISITKSNIFERIHQILDNSERLCLVQPTRLFLGKHELMEIKRSPKVFESGVNFYPFKTFDAPRMAENVFPRLVAYYSTLRIYEVNVESYFQLW